jgi:hypothetical protein
VPIFTISAHGVALVREDLGLVSDARGASRPQWAVWLRLAERDGRLLVSELRIVPAAWGVKAKRSGEWRDDASRYLNVPAAGGITTELLRGIRLGSLLASAEAWLGNPFPFSVTTARDRETAAAFSTAFERITNAAFPDLHVRPRRRRRSGRDDVFYARLATDYLVAFSTGSPHPRRDVAEARGETPERIRDLLHEARRRGLLSKGKPGQRRPGVLSPRATALLDAQRRQRPPARKRAGKRRASR